MKFKSRRKKAIIIATISLVVLLVIATICSLFIINKINGEQINRIIISSLPTKTHYFVGDELVTDGLSIQVIHNNGEFYFVDAESCEISGFDSSIPTESQKVTVSYQGFSTSFNVLIKESPKPAPILTGIHISQMPKTEYKVGEWLDTNGGVLIREYNDGSTKPIDLINNYVYGYTESMCNTPGTYELTVYYVENGDMASCTFTITVTE